MEVDLVIIGGGIAGLWLLDECVRRGDSAVLVNAGPLGTGQTIASQGILHGGLKYTLQGLLTPSAEHIRDMPAVWADCLAGRREPALTETHLRAPHCVLWRTNSWNSRLGLIGARIGLRVTPQVLSPQERPVALADCPGQVFRLDEQVLAPGSLVANFARRHACRIWSDVLPETIQFQKNDSGDVIGVDFSDAQARWSFRPRQVVLTAGKGNADLRARLGLPTSRQQLRPLHMVLLRGNLPQLNGHCVDGSKTRVTITSDTDSQGRTIWQVGGQLAEEGTSLSRADLLTRACHELHSVIPQLNLQGVEGTTYHVDRAEASTSVGQRPDTFTVFEERNVLTAWPTKLVLAPALAAHLLERLPAGPHSGLTALPLPPHAAPSIAVPPWEAASEWHTLVPASHWTGAAA